MTGSKPIQDNQRNSIGVAKPHTIKKFEIMEKYVDEWARKILGVKTSKGIVFIDCMCNSGCYVDEKGSPVEGTPIRITKKLNEIIQKYEHKSAKLYFNDIDENRIQLLKTTLDELCLTNIEIFYYIGDANEFLKSSKLAVNDYFNKLLFYDPYIAAIDWDAITPFLQVWGEVVINHMISDTVRGTPKVRDKDKIKRYENTYQKNIEAILAIGTNRQELDKIITQIMVQRANVLNEEIFISSFPFYNRNNGDVYNLIFFTKKIDGLILFKKVVWKAFGDKSSLKKPHNIEGQTCLDFSGKNEFCVSSEENAYGVMDIVEYIFNKYKNQGIVQLSDIYADLDRHPIFPSDGYKNDIKECLKSMHGVNITAKKIEFK